MTPPSAELAGHAAAPCDWHTAVTITRLIKRERAKRDGVFEVDLDGELF